MRLEVDAGNTLVKWRLVKSGCVVDRGWVVSAEDIEVSISGFG